ncbi:polysaccharide deacetylase family protein [uncultured Chryseobacterium sp.]|uniref:polysaccharide deacetylase family protein n=1 Tax=uncultured Chryseobacterium sp. TaxID=259322 RepID=UPI0025D6E4EB|nr:polysaccharide deacetylase family protein [uncultured Chryseobacterium sp.]
MKNGIINFLSNFERENIAETFPLDYCLPVYHCVSDENLPHLKSIIPYKNTRQFEQDLDFLGKHFQFVTWEEFKDFVHGNFRPKKKIALLTFDDGLREFYEVVMPILERKGIYAINFINPEFIDNKNLMFRCKASLLAEKVKANKNIHPDLFSILPSKEYPVRQILKTGYLQQELLDRLAELLEVDFNTFLKQQQPYMTLDQLKNAARKGFGISSHSWDHPLYHELSVGQQLETTGKTFGYLKRYGFLYESFAFPFTDFGVRKEFFDQMFENKEVFCTFGCAGIKLDSVERNFQRIPMENGEPAETILKKEVAYFRLKKLLNKNKIVRP